MRIVIQCAGSKRSDAHTFRLRDGRSVAFVAVPSLAPPGPEVHYARPDDPSDEPGQSWRDRLVEANRSGEARRLGFLPAGELYTPRAYAILLEAFGSEHLFILSAGWGLVRADFRLPVYDITFSSSVDPHRRRQPAGRFMDFNALAGALPDTTVFVGGKDYLPMFLRLTAGIRARRLVYFNSKHPPQAPGCLLRPYVTPRRTNWHYDCAIALVRGELERAIDGA